MEKIYVLLRQDKQTGPYSLAELIQFDLKPYDLIWIEGRSAGWYYPQEIAALHPYLPFLPQKPKPAEPTPIAEKKVFVQTPIKEAPKAAPSPVVPVEATADAWQPLKPASHNLEAAVFAQFSEPVAAKETPFASAAPSLQKRKSPHPAAVAAVTVLIVGGVFAASWILNRGANSDDGTTELVADPAAQNEIITTAVAADDNTNKQTSALPKQKGPKKNSSASVQASAPSAYSTQPRKEAANTSDAAGNERQAAPVGAEETMQPEEASPTPAETPAAPQEKKKSLKEKIVDLFRKNGAESKAEERRPAENENGERVATRRESGADLAQLVHVRFDVPNDWMMGIKGAKATMVNRSAQKITGATVEVLYYNDDNDLLQKKTINFSKIDAKESKTIAIPDHPTATKVDYNVISVTGQPAA
jgi:hypothetical protein